MALGSLDWKNLLIPRLDGVAINKYKQIPTILPMLYNVGTSKKSQEEYLTGSGLKNFPEFDGQIIENSMSEAYKTTITHTEFASSVSITRKMYDDDLYGVMDKMTRELITAAKRTREVSGIDEFNYAFSSNYTGGDGVSLCNTSHPNPVNMGTVQSNKGTTALSVSSYITARNAMLQFKDWNGETISVNGDTLLVPVALGETALKAVMSTGDPGVGGDTTGHSGVANLLNTVWKPKVIISPYLTDSNNWFLMDSQMLKEQNLWFNRVGLETFDDASNQTLQLKYAAYYRCSHGWTDYRWIYGSEVA